MKTLISSYWKVFQLFFVLFSLYILGDAFYRLDGFLYYSSFSEFLPSFALVFIICSIVAVITSFVIWLLLETFKWFCQWVRWKINTDILIIFLFVFVLVGTIAYGSKKFLFDVGFSFIMKLVVILCVIIGSFFLTWNLRGKLNFILERITPLVWLFNIIVILSVSMIVYHTWIKTSDTLPKVSSQISVVDKNNPNIIVVTFDALSARNMSLYGYHRQTTPFIDRWAKNAAVFMNVKAEDGFTTPAAASFMTGQRVWTHGTYHQRSNIPRGEIENIALLLRNSGYYTSVYVENLNASPVRLNTFESFDEYNSFIVEGQHFLARLHSLLFRLFYPKIKLYDWILLKDFYPTFLFKKYIYYPIYYPIYEKNFMKTQKERLIILDKFIFDINKKNLPEPFFVWLHVMPPHSPYQPPEPFIGTFDSSPYLRTRYGEEWFKEKIKEHAKNKGKFQAFQDMNLLDTYRARYDENILYCDKEFEDFINNLIKRDIINNTVIILSSDHGESFEHNLLGHGRNLYEQVMHIPLVIKYPHQTGRQTIYDLVEFIDIPATILDLANISLPAWMEGRSLVPLIYGQKLPEKRAYSMHLSHNKRNQQIEKGVFAVWDGDYKLIHYLEKNKSLLFNLKQDPNELNNLFNKEHKKGLYLLALIQDNLKKANVNIKKYEKANVNIKKPKRINLERLKHEFLK